MAGDEGLEHGESIKEALVREVHEELGCKVIWVSDNPITFWTINKNVGAEDLKWFGFLLYETKISGDIKLGISDEAHNAKYFDSNEIKKLNWHDNLKPYFLN